MADPIASDKSASSDSPAPAATPAAPPVTVALPTVTAAAPPVTAATSAAVSAPTPEPAPSYSAVAKDSRVKPLQLLVLLIVFAITGVGSLMLLASAMRPPETQPRPASPATPAPEAAVDQAVAATVAPGAAVESPESTAAPRQKWLASANSRKAGYGANMVFELAADNDVEVWRKRVRPVLTMRCAAKTTEVFVVTNAPATIEGNSNRHTVKVSFDDREPVEQTWEHSIDHDALFALNGAGMMRQIGTAKQMSFSWQPFNAPPATATFSVEGFDAHRQTAASKCRS